MPLDETSKDQDPALTLRRRQAMTITYLVRKHAPVALIRLAGGDEPEYLLADFKMALAMNRHSTLPLSNEDWGTLLIMARQRREYFAGKAFEEAPSTETSPASTGNYYAK